MKSILTFWQKHKICDQTSCNWQIGGLNLWCRKVNDELHVAYNHKQQEISTDELNWSRWAIDDEFDEIVFTPIFPNRSVVVAPENPFRIITNGFAKIYVRVPVWIKIEVSKSNNIPISEIPIVNLTDTWFGTFTNGELCYWMYSSGKRKAEADPTRPHLAICPITIKNTSDEELNVEKLCLRVSGLTLYEKDGQLWSNETIVSYQGSNNISDIDIKDAPPSEAANAIILGSPRDNNKKGFSAKTFLAKLIDFPNII